MTITHKDIVTCEIAKDLHTLNFDEECKYYWEESKTTLKSPLPKNQSKRNQIKRLEGTCENLGMMREFENMDDEFQLGQYTITKRKKYLAPTYEEVKTWLRNKHNIDLNIVKTDNHYTCSIITKDISYQVSKEGMYDFETYEDVLKKSIESVISFLKK